MFSLGIYNILCFVVPPLRKHCGGSLKGILLYLDSRFYAQNSNYTIIHKKRAMILKYCSNPGPGQSLTWHATCLTHAHCLHTFFNVNLFPSKLLLCFITLLYRQMSRKTNVKFQSKKSRQIERQIIGDVVFAHRNVN